MGVRERRTWGGFWRPQVRLGMDRRRHAVMGLQEGWLDAGTGVPCVLSASTPADAREGKVPGAARRRLGPGFEGGGCGLSGLCGTVPGRQVGPGGWPPDIGRSGERI